MCLCEWYCVRGIVCVFRDGEEEGDFISTAHHSHAVGVSSVFLRVCQLYLRVCVCV